MVETTTITQTDIQDLITDDPLTKRHFAIQQLQSSELSWKEYMNTLTPEPRNKKKNEPMQGKEVENCGMQIKIWRMHADEKK